MSTQTFDLQGRLVLRAERTGEPIFTVIYADAQSDRVSQILDPEGDATAFSYASGKCTAITDPFGRVSSLAYGGAGDLASITQPDGEVESFTYQAHQMVTKVTRGGLDTTTYAYRTDGTVQSAIKPAGETTTVLPSLSNPGAYVNGAFTRSGSYTDAHGVQHSFVMDLKNTNAPPQTYAYYPNGKLQRYTGPDGTKTFTYDARGLVQTLAVTLSDGGTETWSFLYDAMSRSSQLTFPDGHTRTQEYDGDGRIASRCYVYGSLSYCYTATYDGVGNPLTMTDPYGGSDVMAYDTLNRLTQVTHSIGGIEEHVESYTYNALGALHTSYDPVGMTSVTFNDQRPLVAGGGTGPSAVPATTPDGQTVTLDAGGRITSLEGVTFSYDWRNRVVGTQYTNGADTISESFGYDSGMNRVARTHTETSPSTTTATYYVYDGMDLVGQIDSSKDVLGAYLFDGVDHPLRLRAGGASTYYELDLAGNVRRLRSATGSDLGGYRYTAFGAGFPADAETPAAAVTQSLQWKGRWFEGVAKGTYDVRARWWSPVTGTFLSVDNYRYMDFTTTLWGWSGSNPSSEPDASGDFSCEYQCKVDRREGIQQLHELQWRGRLQRRLRKL